MVRCIGITGGIGAGKSSVLAQLESLGYIVLDADGLSHRATSEPDVRAAIVALLGESSYSAEGAYDRKAVRARVFSDPAARAGLESILHPAITRRFAELAADVERVSSRAWIFYEASLLLEAGREKDFDAVVLVTASEETRIARLAVRNGFSRPQAQDIMAAQWSDARKRALCTHEIVNDGTVADLTQDVMSLVGALKERFAGGVG